MQYDFPSGGMYIPSWRFRLEKVINAIYFENHMKNKQQCYYYETFRKHLQMYVFSILENGQDRIAHNN